VCLPTGRKSLDNLLYDDIEAQLHRFMEDQGVEQRSYATLCVILPFYNVIYIDTESSFRPERIEAIDAAKNADKMTLEEVIVAGQPAFIQKAGGLNFIVSRGIIGTD